MKNKKAIFPIAIIKLFVAAVLLFSGCDHDYYQPELQKGSGSTLFGDNITIPENFEWTTMQTIDLSVKVDDKYNSAYFYIVDLFDSNPLFNENAIHISKGVAKAGMDFKTSIDLPVSLESIYIQQTDPTGGKTIAPVNIVSSSVDYSFTTAGATTRFSTTEAVNGISVNPTFRAAVDKYSLPVLPENCKVITETSGNLSKDLNNGPYHINGNFTGTTNFWGKGDLFISGTLNLTSGHLPIPDGSRLIILPGGSVITPSVNSWGKVEIYVAGNLEVHNLFEVPMNSKCIIVQGGALRCNALDIKSLFYNNGNIHVSELIKTNNAQADLVNENLINTRSLEIATEGAHMSNNGTINIIENLEISNRNGRVYNANSITAQSLTLDNGILENDGIMSITGESIATNNNIFLINNNSFTTNNMFVSSSATVQNNCHLIVSDKLVLEDAKIIIEQGGLLKTSYLTMNNTRVELSSAAMMEVTTLTVYKYNNKVSNHGFYGTGANKALLKINKADFTKKNDENIIHYQGNLEVECYDHSSELLENKRTRWTQSGITWAGAGGSSLVIPSTECNDGGNNNTTPPTPPTDPTFPIIWNGSDVTYLFEDGWPLLGDFDMNDVVMDVMPTYMTNTENKVTQLRLNVVLRALGATKRLAVALQLDGILPSNVTNVTRSNMVGVNETIFPVDKTKGLENDQTYAVIPIFDIAYAAFGKSSPEITNTIKGGSNSAGAMTIPIVIIFSTPMEQTALSIDKFNLFIVNGGYRNSRDEIHLPGFQPTDKANTNKFGSADDNSNAGTSYTSKNDLIWALAIPGSSEYTIEWTSINKAFPEMQGWVISGGESNRDWYKHPVSDLVY